MAWIYLAESEESVLPWKHGSDQLPIVKMSDTLSPCSFLECMKDNCATPQSGQMLEPCVVTCFQMNQSISSLEDSHAKTLALQEMEQAWEESEADYSSKLSDLQKKFAHRLCSSKTCLQLELEDFERSSEHLPIFGMIVGGLVFLPQKLEPHTLEKDGSYLPTPNANEGGATHSKKKQGGMKLGYYVTMFPTPTASPAGTNQGGAAGRTGKVRPSLETMARKNLWPTPKTFYENPKTLLARKERYHKANRAKKPGFSDLQVAVLQKEQTLGQLNPQWVEWLMGYPKEWTVLNALGMQWFQRKREKRSGD